MPTRSTVVDCLTIFLLASLLIGCTPPLRIHQASDASLKQGLPPNKGLAYGRIVVRGWSPTVRADYGTSVEFRNHTTDQRFVHRLSRSGDFHWLLHAGRYEITDVWSGFDSVSQKAEGQGIQFSVLPGQAVYLGELFVQLPSLHSNGTVELFDDFGAATAFLRYRYPSFHLDEAPAKRLFSTPRSAR